MIAFKNNNKTSCNLLTVLNKSKSHIIQLDISLNIESSPVIYDLGKFQEHQSKGCDNKSLSHLNVFPNTQFPDLNVKKRTPLETRPFNQSICTPSAMQEPNTNPIHTRTPTHKTLHHPQKPGIMEHKGKTQLSRVIN
jgi:hypothetical protein